MRTYSEKELLKAIQFACGYQKEYDIFEIQSKTIANGIDSSELFLVLDELSSDIYNRSDTLTIEEINAYIK